jgi:hypothetical protein
VARAVQLQWIMAELAEFSASQAAVELNKRKVSSPGGGQWFAVQGIRGLSGRTFVSAQQFRRLHL